MEYESPDIKVYRKELDETTTISEEPTTSTLLRVLTYRLTCDSSYWQERLDAIMKIIRDTGTDVACLHGVTEDWWKRIKTACGKYFVPFQIFVEEGNTEGTVLMCNARTTRIVDGTQPYYYDFPGSEGRVIGVELVSLRARAKGSFHIVTTELGQDDEQRATEANIVAQVLQSLKNYILAGEFPICEEREEADNILNHLAGRDQWRHMGCPQKLRYTRRRPEREPDEDKEDDETEEQSTKKRSEFIRSARIYSRMTVSSLCLVGLGRTSDSVQQPPSNCYGLLATYVL